MDDVDPESALVSALREVAGLEAGSTETTFAIPRGDLTVTVVYSSGSGSCVELRAPYDDVRGEALLEPGERRAGGYRAAARPRPLTAIRPLAIKLRPETDADRHAKETDTNREFQSGDAAFDAAVYVDSPTDDEVLAALLRPEEVRAAVRALLALGFGNVIIDDGQGRVAATLFTFSKEPVPRAHAEAMVDAFAKLLSELPRVESAPRRRAAEPARVLVGAAAFVGGVGLLALVPTYFALAPDRCVAEHEEGSSLRCEEPGCCEPGELGGMTGLVVGVVVAVAARALLRRWLRRRSDTSTWLTLGTLAAFVLTLEVSMLIAALVGFSGRAG